MKVDIDIGAEHYHVKVNSFVSGLLFAAIVQTISTCFLLYLYEQGQIALRMVGTGSGLALFMLILYFLTGRAEATREFLVDKKAREIMVTKRFGRFHRILRDKIPQTVNLHLKEISKGWMAYCSCSIQGRAFEIPVSRQLPKEQATIEMERFRSFISS